MTAKRRITGNVPRRRVSRQGGGWALLGRLWARFAAALALICLAGAPAQSQGMSALARVLPGSSAAQGAAGAEDGLTLRLALSMPVPWRASVLSDPWRLALDFADVGPEGLDPAIFAGAPQIASVRHMTTAPGWSRIEFALTAPMQLETAAMKAPAGSGRALLEVVLVALEGAAPPVPPTSAPQPAAAPPDPTRQDGSRRLRVAIDPGHGGRDPGAERGGHREADLVLVFALELEEVLLRAGVDVALTRRADDFVPLEDRITRARAFEADLLLSLHADTVAEGVAEGISFYTHAPDAADAAAQKLAERHARTDLLPGLDLSGQDDEVVKLLMSLTRLHTEPRSRALARALSEAVSGAVGGLYHKALLTEDFAVLKAPEMPSVLIELGFMSSARDLANLTDAAWRLRAQQAIAEGLLGWGEADAAEARLIRQ